MNDLPFEGRGLMAKKQMTIQEVAEWFSWHESEYGEVVWSRYIVQKPRRLSLPLVWTSCLSSEMISQTPVGSLLEPKHAKRWVLLKDSDVRIGLLEAESFTWDRLHLIKTAITQDEHPFDDRFLWIRKLPHDQYWAAPFVCPFCGNLNVAGNDCEHFVAAESSVRPRYCESRLNSLLKKMNDREFNCNIMNLSLPDVKVKLPSDFWGCVEWFRFACWYAKTPKALNEVCDILETQELQAREL
jgi:hypothetical protein